MLRMKIGETRAEAQVPVSRITGQRQITRPKAEAPAREIAAGVIGLATLDHFDTQLRRSGLFKII
jgi:hypothetical protein